MNKELLLAQRILDVLRSGGDVSVLIAEAELVVSRISASRNKQMPIWAFDVNGIFLLRTDSKDEMEKALGLGQGTIGYSIKKKILYKGTYFFSADGVFDPQERKKKYLSA